MILIYIVIFSQFVLNSRIILLRKRIRKCIVLWNYVVISVDYFLAQVLANTIDKIARGGTTAIRPIKLSAKTNISKDKTSNIPPMQIRTLLILYVSLSVLDAVLYPAIKLSPLPSRIIIANVKSIKKINAMILFIKKINSVISIYTKVSVFAIKC